MSSLCGFDPTMQSVAYNRSVRQSQLRIGLCCDCSILSPNLSCKSEPSALKHPVHSSVLVRCVCVASGPHMQLQLIVIFIELFMGSWQCWQCWHSVQHGLALLKRPPHNTQRPCLATLSAHKCYIVPEPPGVLDYFHFLTCKAKPAPKVDRCKARIPPERETRARCWCCYCC